jgi:hypothetical protein
LNLPTILSQSTVLIGLASQFSASGITCGCIIRGTVTAGELPTSNPKKPGGVTPMIVKGFPSISIFFPTMPAERPNLLCQ